MRPIRLILTQSEKGGCGKTTIQEALVTGLRAGGSTVVAVDADDGVSGYISRCGKGSALALSWTTSADSVMPWMTTHLADADVVTIDCGANLIASGAPINAFLGEFVVRVVEAGGSVTPLAIASTNAPGADRVVRAMRDAFGDYGKVRLVQNDQDGSSAFPRSLATLGMPTATFPHIAPGFVQARMLEVAPLLNILRSPPEHYAMAIAAHARAVARFMREPAVQDLFEPQAIDEVTAYAAEAPGTLQRAVYQLSQATDEALKANMGIVSAKKSLWQAAGTDRSDITSISEAALGLIDAEVAYFAAIK